jgi:hypothetical protein
MNVKVMLAEACRLLGGLSCAMMAGCLFQTVGMALMNGGALWWGSEIFAGATLSIIYRTSGTFWNRLFEAPDAG